MPDATSSDAASAASGRYVPAFLQQILDAGLVTDGRRTFPLTSNVNTDDGRVIAEAFRATRPRTSLEVGLGYGVSALYACHALSTCEQPAKHIIIDPDQDKEWQGIGRRNLIEAGYGALFELIAERSETALPTLLRAGTKIQAAIIDGWHTFDQALVDFFYVNKLLEPGGIIIFASTQAPSIDRLIRYIRAYPAYRLFDSGREPVMPRLRQRARRKIAAVTGLRALQRAWDRPTSVALQKTAPDDRNWDWYADF